MSEETVALREKINELNARWWTLNRLEDELYIRLNEIFNERAAVADLAETLEKSFQQLKSADPPDQFARPFTRE